MDGWISTSDILYSFSSVEGRILQTAAV